MYPGDVRGIAFVAFVAVGSVLLLERLLVFYHPANLINFNYIINLKNSVIEMSINTSKKVKKITSKP